MKFGIHCGLSMPDKNGKCCVVMRVSHQSKRDNLHTGITLLPSQWNKNKERVKQGCTVGGMKYNVLNDRLATMEKFVEDYFNGCALRSTPTTLSDLKRRFNHKFNSSASEQSDEFFFLFKQFREETASIKGWSESRKEMMLRLENKVRDFKADIKFSDLSTATMEAFKCHLSKTMYNDALKKHLAYFGQFIAWAKSKRYEIHEDYFQYKPVLKMAEKDVRCLELSELDTIYYLDLSGRDGLDRARDVFIFQCYTGLRESDVSKLKRENIQLNSQGEYMIDIVTKKDKDRIKFRLPQRAVNVYLKYKDNVYENDLAFPIISQQKYNEHLKKLGEAAELKGEWLDYEYRLNEEIIIRTPKHKLSSHTARRTFIVTAMNEGVSLDIIALITSHADIEGMKKYIKANRRGTDAVIDAIDNITTREQSDGEAEKK